MEAVARTLDETRRGMEEVAKSATEGQAVQAIIERYLSVGHLNSPGSGCEDLAFTVTAEAMSRRPPCSPVR